MQYASRLEEASDHHGALADDGSEYDREDLSMDIGDRKGGDEENEREKECEALAGEEPFRLVESEQRDQNKIIPVGYRSQQEHERKHIPEFGQEVPLIRQEREDRGPQKRSQDDQKSAS